MLNNSTFKYKNVRILMFAKEPVAGQVKTRMQGRLGIEGALDLHCALIEYQLSQVLRGGLAPVELWVSANPEHPFFKPFSKKVSIYQQEGTDLGARMAYAARVALGRAESVILVGTDCPSVDTAYLEEAITTLKQSDVVLGPADDGGYVLLGMNQVVDDLFVDMPWGSSQVLSLSTRRLVKREVNFGLLSSRWDVDRPADLGRLAELQPPLDFQLP